MLHGCSRDRWPLQYLMTNEVERAFYNARLLCSLFGKFISLVISNDVCVGSNFADGDIVVAIIICVMRSLSRRLYWEDVFLIWLRRKLYVVEAICEYECIYWERFGVFSNN